jgi:hypothetical protein
MLYVVRGIDVGWKICINALTLRPPTFHPPVHFFPVSAFLLTRRRPCRREAPSTALAAPGNHEPLIGGAQWRSMGVLHLGQSVTWSFCGWTHRQRTNILSYTCVKFWESYTSLHCKKKLREIPMWTMVARTKRHGGRKIPTLTRFGSAPPLSTSEFGAFRHGFFYSAATRIRINAATLWHMFQRSLASLRQIHMLEVSGVLTTLWQIPHKVLATFLMTHICQTFANTVW